MKNSLKRIGASSLVALGLLGGAVVGTAAPAAAAEVPCGQFVGDGNILNVWSGKWERATWNNCKNKPVLLSVKRTYNTKQVCVSTGLTTLYAEPTSGGALMDATWTGKYC